MRCPEFFGCHKLLQIVEWVTFFASSNGAVKMPFSVIWFRLLFVRMSQ